MRSWRIGYQISKYVWKSNRNRPVIKISKMLTNKLKNILRIKYKNIGLTPRIEKIMVTSNNPDLSVYKTIIRMPK